MFSLALLVAAVIFVVFVGSILYEIRPFANYERGLAALIWSLPISIFLTMILVYLDTPYIFLSLFDVPALSALLLPPGKRGVWRVLVGVLSTLPVLIMLITSGGIEL